MRHFLTLTAAVALIFSCTSVDDLSRQPADESDVQMQPTEDPDTPPRDPPRSVDGPNFPPVVTISRAAVEEPEAGPRVLKVVVQPSGATPSLEAPYDTDSSARLYILLDKNADPSDDDPNNPDPARIVVLDAIDLPVGAFEVMAFEYQIDAELIPEAFHGTPLFLRVTIDDGVNIRVHAYADITVRFPEDESPDDPCRSQCELGAGECVERGIGEFGGYRTTLREWRTSPETIYCGIEDDYIWAVAGSCRGGAVLILDHGTGFFGVTKYYERNTRRFIGLTTWTDVWDEECQGMGYWPEPVDCPNAVVTEVICGTYYEVGDPLYVP